MYYHLRKWSQDGSLEQVWQSAIVPDDSGLIAFTITEEQITSYLAKELQSRPEQVLYNPQVYLNNGHIDIYGQVKTDVVTANAHLTMTVKVDEQGNPELEIVNVNFGPVPIPGSLLDSLSTMLNDILLGSITPMTTGFKVEDYFIDNGMITITGTKR